jgi:hypothetical protein
MSDTQEYLFNNDKNLHKLWLEQYEQLTRDEWDQMAAPLDGIINQVSFRDYDPGGATLNYRFEKDRNMIPVTLGDNGHTSRFNKVLGDLIADIKTDKTLHHLKLHVEKYSSPDLKWQVFQVFNEFVTVEESGKNLRETKNKICFAVACFYNNRHMAFEVGKHYDRNMRKARETRDGSRYYEYNFKQFEEL